MNHSSRFHLAVVNVPVRRGATYVAVLGAAVVLSLISVGTLGIIRSQQTSTFALLDEEYARRNAESATQMVLAYIEKKPTWRANIATDMTSGTLSLARGSAKIQVRDPVDNDLANSVNDPIEILATGYSGQAIYRCSSFYSFEDRPLDCLDAATCANGNLILSSATVDSVDTLATNSNSAGSSINLIRPKVEASGSISGILYLNTTKSGVAKRTMPAFPDVFSYYESNGTAIASSAIPTSTTNLLSNGNFENGTTYWDSSWEDGFNCTLGTSTSNPPEGAKYLQVTNRTAAGDGPCQDITDWLQSGVTYTISARVKPKLLSNYRFSVYIKAGSSGAWTNSPTTTVLSTGWATITWSFTPSFTGQLEKATLKISSDSLLSDSRFDLDDVKVIESGTNLLVNRQLITKSSNPFGAANANGIYVIDCAGKKIFFDNCRIDATIVLKNVGAGSGIRRGAMHWSPPSKNFPALLIRDEGSTGNSFDLGATQVFLSEPRLGKNLNPTTDPDDEFGSDSDMLDLYRSRICGLVYSTRNLRIHNNVHVEGVILANGTITFNNSTTITYDPIFFQNPPPGFTYPAQLQYVTNSLKRDY